MKGRKDGLGLAFLSGGSFLLLIAVRAAVGGDGLPVIPLIGGLVLAFQGWEWLDLDERIVELFRQVKQGDRRLIILGVAGLLLVAIVVVVVTQQTREPYPNGAKATFMVDCTKGQSDWHSFCGCEYSYLQEHVDYDRYQELAAEDPNVGEHEPEIQGALRHCIVEEHVPLPRKIRNQLPPEIRAQVG